MPEVTKTRALFFGTPEFAVPILRALQAHPRIALVAVVTQPDQPAGRGRVLAAPPVKQLAQSLEVEVMQPERIRSGPGLESILTLGADLIVVAAYGKILPAALLTTPRFGCINVHASLLPTYRGASPITQAILSGDAETGVSIMHMAEGCDTGPVYLRAQLPLAPDDTHDSLSDKLAHLGAQALCDWLPCHLDGLSRNEQQSGEATLAPRLSKQNGLLDFTRPAAEIERRVRAMSRWPGAFCFHGRTRVKVHESRVEAAAGNPGEVLEAGPHGVLVACGEGALRLLSVQPEGKRTMTAGAWASGSGPQRGNWLASLETQAAFTA